MSASERPSALEAQPVASDERLDVADAVERGADLVELPLEERVDVFRDLLERVPRRRRAGV